MSTPVAPTNPINVDVDDLLGKAHNPAFQFLLLALCGMCLIIDGFDAQAMGYVAPSLFAEWDVPKTALGPVFSASLVGMLVGALCLSILADRIGRRPVLIGATLFFAIAMLVTPLTGSILSLMVARFVTGLGLGCIMPNAMALVGEYSAPDHRVKRMMLVSCGFTVGAAIGGFISAALIPAFGWRSVFWVGGVAPLLLALGMLAALPESLQFLALKDRQRQARRWLAKCAPSQQIPPSARLIVQEKPASGAPVVDLFRSGRAPVTLILWAISFLNLIDLYFLSNWLPTVMHDAGYTPATAVIVGTMLQTGGVIGTLMLGRFIEQFGFVRVLSVCFAVAAVSVGLIGTVAHALPWLLLAVFVGGFCLVGGQPAVNALAGHYYPTALRSTGIGWSLGVGRIGSVLGPLIGGQLIALQWSNGALFQVAALPVIGSALLVILLAGRGRKRSVTAVGVRSGG